MNQHHSGSHTPNSGDISKGIDRVIEVTVYEARVEEGDDGEGIPYDPNLVYPKWFTHFRSFLQSVTFTLVTTPIEVTPLGCWNARAIQPISVIQCGRAAVIPWI